MTSILLIGLTWELLCQESNRGESDIEGVDVVLSKVGDSKTTVTIDLSSLSVEISGQELDPG